MAVSRPRAVIPYTFDPESDPETEDTVASETPPQQRLLQDASEWCTCGNCMTMPTEGENVCCRETLMVIRRMNELPDTPTCMIYHPGLEPNCLNPYTLQNMNNIYRADYGPLRGRTIHEYSLPAFSIPQLCQLVLGIFGTTCTSCHPVVCRVPETPGVS
ncbi:uncharacterized protein LOC131470267 isoform X2 [Solea solea]|uniref:uncharacterized protein LOC131462793 isoform X2 n=1 Tax=Solea solea TaxID=90069 RepID=UPI00272A7351|nr:uncharacterized protein LOC131462793 isoform X2 [Solea solea]XP_058501963.1 uncharacterized protein LOC131470267 isoform X2 [Solea solea]